MLLCFLAHAKCENAREKKGERSNAEISFLSLFRSISARSSASMFGLHLLFIEMRDMKNQCGASHCTVH